MRLSGMAWRQTMQKSGLTRKSPRAAGSGPGSDCRPVGGSRARCASREWLGGKPCRKETAENLPLRSRCHLCQWDLKGIGGCLEYISARGAVRPPGTTRSAVGVTPEKIPLARGHEAPLSVRFARHPWGAVTAYRGRSGSQTAETPGADCQCDGKFSSSLGFFDLSPVRGHCSDRFSALC